MSSSLVFNDASIPFQSSEECSQYLPVFFEILKQAFKNQVQMVRVDENVGSNWYRVVYASDFSFSQWIESQTDRDYKRSLKMIMDKTYCPLIFPEEKELLDSFDLSSFELVLDNSSVPAIGSAFLLGMPVVSFLSMPHWKEGFIDIQQECLDPHSAQVREEFHSVENISQLVNLSTYLGKIRDERQASKAYLKTLVQYENDDYKNLILCPNVLDAFNQLGATVRLLNKIKEVLESLNKIIETANSEGEIIKNLALTITGESDSTKNNPSLLKYRKFKLPDGAFLTFDLHVKNFPEGQRLYFCPDFQQKKIYIGYFGKHLPI